jgi:hypothetical protein
MIQQLIVSDFVPKARLIANVTVGFQAEVTTTQEHGYENDQIVRLIVPKVYGMNLYNEAKVTVTSPTTFLTDVDTSNQFAFVSPTFMGDNPFTQAQVVPITGVEDNIAR